MTTRDPRSRVPMRPADTGRGESAREPTQSLSNEIDPADDAEPDSSQHPSLAVGTADAVREERTKVESPAGRVKKPQPRPPKQQTKPPEPRGGESD